MVLNGHGGNIGIFTRLGLEYEKRGCLVACLNWWLIFRSPPISLLSTRDGSMPRMAAVSSPPPWPPFQAGFMSQAMSHQFRHATRQFKKVKLG